MCKLICLLSSGSSNFVHKEENCSSFILLQEKWNKKCKFRIGVDDVKKLNKKEKEQEQEQVTIVWFVGCVARRLYRNSSSYLKHGMHGSAEKWRYEAEIKGGTFRHEAVGVDIYIYIYIHVSIVYLCAKMQIKKTNMCNCNLYASIRNCTQQ